MVKNRHCSVQPNGQKIISNELKQKAVAYINSDGNGRGFIGASGSHTLEPFFNQIMDDVIDPQTGVTIKERRMQRRWWMQTKASVKIDWK